MRVVVGAPGGGGHPADGDIPALLLRPAPERDTGAGMVLVAGHGPGIVGLVDREDGYHHGLAHDLAAAGVTVLCPEMISFGSRRTGPVGPPEESSCRVDAARFGLHGRPVLGRRVADAAAAVAALRGQPGVDPARVAVAGGSGGGAVALMLAAADEDVAGALVATYLSSFAASIAALPHCPCNIVPGLLPELLLVGRNEEKLRTVAEHHGIARWTTSLEEALAEPGFEVYFDALVTPLRVANIKQAIAAGKAVYAEKPTAETFADALELARPAQQAGTLNGVVHDKLYLPGLLKLRRLIASGFFGEILSVRGEFGYWVYEGGWQEAQRPSWNYRAEDGGGIVVDMFPHWNYVIEDLFGRIVDVYAQTATHIDRRWDEQGREYAATADDAAYGIFRLENGVVVQMNSSWDVRVHRGELVEFQVDGTKGSAVVGLHGARVQPREATPKPVWNPDVADGHDYYADWIEVPDNEVFDKGFKVQWEDFLRHVAAGEPYPYDFLSGARGMRLAETVLASAEQGRRIALDPLTEV